MVANIKLIIAVAISCVALPAGGQQPKSGESTAFALAPAGAQIVLTNQSESSVRYRIAYASSPVGKRDELPPGESRVWRVLGPVMCSIDEKKVPLEGHGHYVFRERAGTLLAEIELQRALIQAADEVARPTRQANVDEHSLPGNQRRQQQVTPLASELPSVRDAPAPANVAQRSAGAEATAHSFRTLDLRSAPTLPTGRDAVVVLSWPFGAAVYLSGQSTSGRWDRTFVGVTPLSFVSNPGALRVTLAPPTDRPGHWAAPRTANFAGQPPGSEAAHLTLDVEKQADAPLHLRALWLTTDGTPVERLLTATADAPALFASLDEDAFQDAVFKELTSARAEPDEELARQLTQVFRKTGYLQYALNETAALDFEMAVGGDSSIKTRFVRISR